jgi:2,3-dihydroxybenzoate---[aryl-carrier protein] ligase
MGVMAARYSEDMVRRYVDGGYWRPELTVDFWDRNARERAHEPALADSVVTYTWSEAAQAIDRLAAALLADGYSKYDIVLVQARNSANLMLLRLACEKAGIVLAFLHYGFRRNEIESAAALTQPAGAIFPAFRGKFDFDDCYRELQRRFPTIRRCYHIDGPAERNIGSIAAMLQCQPSQPSGGADQRFEPFEMTGIVASSGTTGLPKYIEYSPWPRLASGRVYIERLQLTSADVSVACVPLYTGNADLFFHTAPQIGAKQVLLEAFSPQALCAAIEKHRATVAIVVPTMLARLVDFADLKRFDLRSLRFLNCGGGMLPYEIGLRAEQALGGKIIQTYGLMDYGALASHGADDPQTARLNSNGRILDGTELLIVDERGRPVPPGQVGQICARGPHCNGGYFKDPAATAAAWPDGYLRTGDLGQVDEGGFLKLEGRSKDIIIRGGQNISAKELEAILCRHRQVVDAAVVRMADPDMGERACAFIVPKKGAAISFEDISLFIRQQGLAAFKIPERVELVAELPMNTAGKVDKRLLEERLRQAAGKPEVGTDNADAQAV